MEEDFFGFRIWSTIFFNNMVDPKANPVPSIPMKSMIMPYPNPGLQFWGVCLKSIRTAITTSPEPLPWFDSNSKQQITLSIPRPPNYQVVQGNVHLLFYSKIDESEYVHISAPHRDYSHVSYNNVAPTPELLTTAIVFVGEAPSASPKTFLFRAASRWRMDGPYLYHSARNFLSAKSFANRVFAVLCFNCRRFRGLTAIVCKEKGGIRAKRTYRRGKKKHNKNASICPTY